MAEFCKNCFVNSLLDTEERNLFNGGKLLIKESDFNDLCEGCGEWKPVVLEAYVN